MKSGVDRVPLLDLSRQYAGLRDEIVQAVTRVCDSQRYVLSDEVTAFEQEAAQFLGAAGAAGCANGTDALWLGLIAAGVGTGDEVITTSFSFFATAGAIVRCGARPVFADVERDTLNLDPADVERKLRRRVGRVKAIMPVHLYGQCADMDALQRIAAEHKVALVEDAAQAFGATWRGKHAGALGLAAGFSFYPTKNLSTFGDGGLVTSNDAEVIERIKRLRNHGSRIRYHHEEFGWNSRLDSVHAAILRVKLKHVEGWNRERARRAAYYNSAFDAAGLTRGSGTRNPAQVVLPVTRPLASHIYHQYVVRVQRRDRLRQFLAERHIGTEVYYPVPLHLQKAVGYLGYGNGDLPECERAAQEVLALPIFPELTEDEQAYVVQSIADFYS